MRMAISSKVGSAPGLSGPVVATESMLCCTGPPLPETLKLLAPLANLEELSLTGNELGGTITADVIVLANLKELDLASMGLDGKPLSTRSERFNGSLKISTWCARTGELPLEIIRMKAKGVDVRLKNNAGFTLPANIGELGDDITKLDLSNCSLTGPRSTRTERLQISC